MYDVRSQRSCAPRGAGRKGYNVQIRLLAALMGVGLLLGCKEEKTAAAAAPLPALPAELQDSPDYSGENAYVHCARLCALGPRPSGSAAYAAQLDYLEHTLTACGWQVQRDSFSARGVPMVNLRAVRGKGFAESPRPVLVSCHIDTKSGIEGFVGADDGTSAAAVMLELARTLPAELAEQAEFIFLDGEEAFARRMNDADGLYGSKYDVARRTRSGQLPLYQINLDMVGGRNKVIAVPALDTEDDMYAHYARAVRTLGFSPEHWTAWPGSYMDDHRPYLLAGVNSLNLIAYFSGGNWWHTAKDDMSRICPRSLHESGLMVLQLLKQLKEKR